MYVRRQPERSVLRVRRLRQDSMVRAVSQCRLEE